MDLDEQTQREAKQKRFESWPLDRRRWVDSIDYAVSDFMEASMILDYLDEEDEEYAAAHNEYCKAFNEVWRRLCSFKRESPRSIELVQCQWAGLEGHKKVGYIHYLALKWSASTGLPVEDFVGEFAESLFKLVNEGFDFRSGYFFVETLSLFLKSRAQDLYRAEKMTDKRKANYGTVSLDVIDDLGTSLHETISSPGDDPLIHVLGHDYEYDTRLLPEERRVAQLLVEGLTYSEIAQELGFRHHEQARRIHQRLKRKFSEDY